MSTATPIVIIVEDDAKIRRFIKLALEAEQLEVFEADSVARGLIEVGTRQPDLVVLDLGLPDGDGIDLIRDLRTWSDIPIIVLSARTAEADKVAALDAGATGGKISGAGGGGFMLFYCPGNTKHRVMEALSHFPGQHFPFHFAAEGVSSWTI